MSKLKSFNKLDSVKKKSNKSSWIILSVSVLVVTIIIFSSYAKYLSISKEVAIANSTTGDFYYREDLLNGTDPVLTDNLIPVTISDTGSVAKADLYNEWYKYEDKKWANAVKLFEKEVTIIKDSSGKGNDGTAYGNLVEGYGYASFAKDGDYIDSGVGSGLDLGTDYSVAIKFVYDNNEDIYRRRLISGGGIDVYLQNDGRFMSSFGYVNEEGTVVYKSLSLDSNFLEDNKIYDIVFVYNNGIMQLYVNGELIKEVSTGPYSVLVSDCNYLIGTTCSVDGSRNVHSYDKNIYFVSVSSTAFTEEEIEYYYKNEELSNKEDLLFEYKFFDAYAEDMTDIAEDDIESYFVWIPKYSYQLWDLGTYNSLTTTTSKEQTINIKFGRKNTTDGVIGECATPAVAGESGTCVVGDYMTHPAFLAFDTNGLWVGKFETGYAEALDKDAATIDSSDSSKVIIKPDIYSWRGLSIGNMFKVSYDYNREHESHMMKNTEWGAVAYLSHSNYGINSEVRINNNYMAVTGFSALENPILGTCGLEGIEGNQFEYVDPGENGNYTINYFDVRSVISSTTGNYSGIYDMSGGSWEYTMAIIPNIGSDNSGITNIYSDFFTNENWSKYYDKYNSTSIFTYSDGFFGDATREMGPFEEILDVDNSKRVISSWYSDYSIFDNQHSWFRRGGYLANGTGAGIFAHATNSGVGEYHHTFRIVLAPTN